MATVYILYSEKIDSFYTGSCLDLDERLQQHLSKTFDNAFTSRADDWSIFFKIDNLHYLQARNIEQFIKSMKSKKFITLIRTICMTEQF